MEKMNEAILSFYRSKFALTDEQLKAYMDEETWFSGAEAQNFGLKCEVVKGGEDVRLAASLNKYNFKHIPRGLTMEQEEEKKVEEQNTVEEQPTEEQKTVEVSPSETTEEQPKVEEQNTVEEKAEEEKTEPTVEELQKENEELKKQVEELTAKLNEFTESEEEEEKPEEVDVVTKAECESRVKGMQSSMQKQVNDFQDRLQKSEKELSEAKASITSLNEQLEAKAKELSDMASAYAAQKKTLEVLNSNVNTPNDELPTFADGLRKCNTPAERVAFIKSGKYVR